jgi:hypothetical protein
MNDFGSITYGLFGTAIYLDTNVWSELAKGNLPLDSLEFLLQRGNAYLSLGPFQMIELCRRPDFGPRLINIFYEVPVCMAARSAESELTGQPAAAVGFDFFITLRDLTPVAEDTWLEQFESLEMTRDFDQKRQQLITDRQWGIEVFRNSSQHSVGRPWTAHFWRSLDQYLRQRCTEAAQPYRQDRLKNGKYYRGLKLHFAMLYLRHYLHSKRWEDSDLLDLLHAFQMAYADVIVTERSMKATLSEIGQHLPEMTVPESFSLVDVRNLNS